MAIKLGINGAAGRMGLRLIALSAADTEFKLAGGARA